MIEQTVYQTGITPQTGIRRSRLQEVSATAFVGADSQRQTRGDKLNQETA